MALKAAGHTVYLPPRYILPDEPPDSKHHPQTLLAVKEEDDGIKTTYSDDIREGTPALEVLTNVTEELRNADTACSSDEQDDCASENNRHCVSDEGADDKQCVGFCFITPAMAEDQPSRKPNIDIPTLIREVESERCLWDTSSMDYTNKHLKDLKWKKVGEACGCTGLQAKQKFKNQRTAFKRKKNRHIRSGFRASAAGRPRERSYDLHFLDSVPRRGKASTDPVISPVQPTTSYFAAASDTSSEPAIQSTQLTQITPAPAPHAPHHITLNQCTTSSAPSVSLHTPLSQDTAPSISRHTALTQDTAPPTSRDAALTEDNVLSASLHTELTYGTGLSASRHAELTQDTAPSSSRHTTLPQNSTPSTPRHTELTPDTGPPTSRHATLTHDTAPSTLLHAALTQGQSTTPSSKTCQSKCKGQSADTSDELDSLFEQETGHTSETAAHSVEASDDCHAWGMLVAAEMRLMGGEQRRCFKGKLVRLLADLYP